MRFGCCLGFAGTEEDHARVESLARMGFQYLELPAETLRPEGDPGDYYALRREVRRAALTPEVVNCLIPTGLKLVGNDVDWRRVEKLVALILDRAEEIGARTVVFGCAEARRIPPDYPRDEALDQLRYFLGMTADYAGELMVAVHPLAAEYTNSLNSIEETADLVRKLGRAQLGLGVDSYHMDLSQEPWEALEQARGLVAHVHCADRGRTALGQGGADLTGFFAALAALEYDGRVTLEAELDDSAEVAQASLEVLRQLTGARS